MTEEEIEQTARASVAEYFADAKAQQAAFDQWLIGGRKGDRPRIQRGDLPSYIARAFAAHLGDRTQRVTQPVPPSATE